MAKSQTMLVEVSYDVHGKPYPGYLANGAKTAGAPGILVFHGGSGMGPQAKETAERLAQMGYVAFAPDLFNEPPIIGLERSKARGDYLMEHHSELDARCHSALRVLCNQPRVDPKRLAAIGWCYGGQVALELGRSGADLTAIVGFHAALKTNRPQASANIKARVLVCVGDRDPFVSQTDRTAFMENMTASGIDCQLLLFSGIEHSFADRHAAGLAKANNISGVTYNAAADRRSWLAMQALFAEAFS